MLQRAFVCFHCTLTSLWFMQRPTFTPFLRWQSWPRGGGEGFAPVAGPDKDRVPNLGLSTKATVLTPHPLSRELCSLLALIVLRAGCHSPEGKLSRGIGGHLISVYFVLITYSWLRSQAASFPEIRLNLLGQVAAFHPIMVQEWDAASEGGNEESLWFQWVTSSLLEKKGKFALWHRFHFTCNEDTHSRGKRNNGRVRPWRRVADAWPGPALALVLLPRPLLPSSASDSPSRQQRIPVAGWM